MQFAKLDTTAHLTRHWLVFANQSIHDLHLFSFETTIKEILDFMPRCICSRNSEIFDFQVSKNGLELSKLDFRFKYSENLSERQLQDSVWPLLVSTIVNCGENAVQVILVRVRPKPVIHVAPLAKLNK